MTPTEWNYVLGGACAVLALGNVVLGSLFDRVRNDLKKVTWERDAMMKRSIRSLIEMKWYPGRHDGSIRSFIEGIRVLAPLGVVLELHHTHLRDVRAGHLRVTIAEPMGRPGPKDFPHLRKIGRKR